MRAMTSFRQLHQAGCFVMPNPWDAGSARFLESLGFPALATTSAGFAFSQGRADGAMTREAVVEAVAPRPVNVLVSSPWTTVAELRDAGVRRISVGGALARAAWGGFLRAAREIASSGTFAALNDATPHTELDRFFH